MTEELPLKKRILPVATAARTNVATKTTRTRLHAVTAAAAFAIIGAFAAPTAALAAGSSDTTPVVQDAAQGAPTTKQLHPAAVSADQQTFTPSAEQLTNAKAIIEAGKKLGLPPRAWVIAIGTSLQETGLKNLGHLGENNDHDSLGLFQQRPTSGWGTPEEITDPAYAATAFYKGLVEVDGWDSLPLTEAAQAVQVSAFPDHYAKHEAEAGAIVSAFFGAGPYAQIAAGIK